MTFIKDLDRIINYSKRISEYPTDNTLQKLFHSLHKLIQDYPAETSAIKHEIENLEYNYKHALVAIRLFDVDIHQKLRSENYSTKRTIIGWLGALKGEKMSQIKQKSKRIFVVHGHDNGMKQHVARIIGLFGLEPIILSEQPNRGSETIIEKLERYSDVGFAVILLSPDDFVINNNNPQNIEFSRARQNVIFEYGYFASKLGRACVFPLQKKSDSFEIPSDISGIVLNRYEDSSRDWIVELAIALRDCQYTVDLDKALTW